MLPPMPSPEEVERQYKDLMVIIKILAPLSHNDHSDYLNLRRVWA
jgi:hypothetical protein